MESFSATTRSLTLGAIGVLIFSLTLPMTKIAMQGGMLSAVFTWSGRTVLGAMAGITYLLLKGARIPPRASWLPILGAAVGIVLGWPLLNTIALQSTDASHAAVINGILPLATALIGAKLNRETLSRRFWWCAVLGSAIVCAYAWVRSTGALHVADALLFVGIILGGFGYACGAIATRYLDGSEVISWALIIALPITTIITAKTLPMAALSVPLTAWIAFAYLGLMSQWVGFFFWYRGLALGGIAKVSQIQLLQMFCTLAASAIFLTESIDLGMLSVAFVTMTLVALGRRK